MIANSMVCVPSRLPSTRYSALPLSPGPMSSTSSEVPSLPSGPGLRMAWSCGTGPAAVCAMRSGSSSVPTTPSSPLGRTMLACRFVTTRFEPAGATLPTISITLKNWSRKPMSPGMTTTPGMGGTKKFWPASCGTLSENPTTLRFGICVWSWRSVSGMIVCSVGSTGAVSIPPRRISALLGSCAPCSVGSTTVMLSGIFLSSTAKPTAKLKAWKLERSKTMPLSRISASVRGRAVTCVMSSFSMTSMLTLSGAPRSSSCPPLRSRMFSSVCSPGWSGGMWNWLLGRVVRFRPWGNVGPRSIAVTTASGAKGAIESGSVGACSSVLTTVAMSLGTVWVAGCTSRPRPKRRMSSLAR